MKFPLNKKTNGKRKPSDTAASPADSESPMDLTLLERLVKLMSANDLNTVDLRDGDKRVILKRGQAAAGALLQTAQAAPAYAAPAAPAAPQSPQAEPDEETDLIPIKSPMVGTFYASPAPDAKPFVAIGSTVDDDTDVCVIEAMKVFNNIKAECHGQIAKIVVTNGQTVEFGQVLFLVKPQ